MEVRTEVRTYLVRLKCDACGEDRRAASQIPHTEG